MEIKDITKNESELLKIVNDKRNFLDFIYQADILDNMIIDDIYSLALCDTGDEEDWIFLLKNGKVFEWQRIMSKKLFVKAFSFLYEQFTEMRKNNKTSKFLNERLKNERD